MTMGSKASGVIPLERVTSCIFLLRGEKVMFDFDLAELYGVETGALNRAVQRNVERFPSDFLFKLRPEEVVNLKCQIGISSSAHGGRRRSVPYAFTEQGVAMLSSVLRSPRAVEVNIEIMRAFVRLRRLLLENVDLARKLAELEKRYDGQFRVVFEAIRELMEPAPTPGKRLGFGTDAAS
jgi:ORF6N domain